MPYYIEPDLRRASEIPITSKSVRSRTQKTDPAQEAFRNLGMDFLQPLHSGAQSLEAEVDNYLAVPTRNMNSIAFWEVCCTLNLINAY
jgi:hypothetical protein